MNTQVEVKQATKGKVSVKTIDVTALSWFDKVNGNSYFAGTITVNYGMKGEQTFKMPFQYGYGDQYISEAASILDSNGIIKLPEYPNGNKGSLWEYCRNNKIILRTTKHENCKKSELKNI